MSLLALVGPTAAGKSEIALEVAARLDAEVVAVDAFTVYRGMDVGTAKPTPAARAAVRHHMVDVLEPTQECTVRWFQHRARAAIDDVRVRGRTALLVGGSGLYFRAVVDGLAFPPTDPDVRAAVAARYDFDPAAAHAALSAVDPAAAGKIDPANLRRSVRALEVLELTGRPFSAFAPDWSRYTSTYPGLVVVGLEVPREALIQRVEARVDAMMAGGMVEECEQLRRFELSATARQAIGYAEVLDALDGRGTVAEAAERAKARTRRYAARQRRWFAADPRVRWVPPEQAPATLVSAVAGG